MKPWEYILLGAGVVIAILLGFVVGRSFARVPAEPPVERIDTLVVHDTTTIVEPRDVIRRVIDSVRVPVPVTDTIVSRDTIYVSMVREQVVWEDSLARVYASGIMPNVDSVTHFTERTIITKETIVRQKDRWGIGIQAGVGAGKGGFTPYVGVGLSYNVFTWSFKRDAGKKAKKDNKKR